MATGDTGLRDRREHDALEEAVLVHSGHVPCPEKCATREVVLKASGRLLEPGLNVVLVGQVEMEQRAEAHERFLKANGAATVEQQVRGGVSAVGVYLRLRRNMASVLLRLALSPT